MDKCLKNLWCKKIEEHISNHQMPLEFQNTISYNYCNDCQKKSYSKYHFLYNKCHHCNGFNTNQPEFIKDFANIFSAAPF